MPNNTLFTDFCRHCGSINLAKLPEPTNSKYHARLVCVDCQAFLKSLPKPSISITRLLQDPCLEPWERKFLKSVVFHQPTQSETIVLEAIQAKFKTTYNDAG